MRKRENLKNAAIFTIILLLVLVFLIGGLHILGSTVLQNGAGQEPTDKKTIIRDGVEYFPRQDICVTLLMGIDRGGPANDSGSHRNDGTADMVMLLIFNETQKDYTILFLDRDTMLTMPASDLEGRPDGTCFGQLALAHTFGNGLERSCENVKEAVSAFLYDLKIDHYVSMDLDAIAMMNDALGGVKVTVTEDFSHVDPTIPTGEVLLRGQQALRYIRTQENAADPLNLTRIHRQMDYMRGFFTAFRASAHQSMGFLASAYTKISPYMITDCSTGALLRMALRYGDYDLRQIITPEGELVPGEDSCEFHVDEDALDALILDLFYRPKK